ncbi:VaFE repeat-containing surface-anchored protein, partial [Cutibacterium acnes]|uniref:VaFE repeat-containing surface-anchored protein n=1 Tax=Cutibacterium acnes TaxID=1747 RepID=UPI00254DA634
TDTADGDHAIVGGKAATLSDKVAYSNAAKGTTYTLSGELVDKASGKNTGIKASKVFTAAKADGSVPVDFRVPAGFAG